MLRKEILMLQNVKLKDKLHAFETDQDYVEPITVDGVTLDYANASYIIREFNTITDFKYDQEVSKPEYIRAQDNKVVGVEVKTTITLHGYGARQATIFKPISSMNKIENTIKSAETIGFVRCVRMFNMYIPKKIVKHAAMIQKES